jgi:uncharacterized protein YqgC (DUF456 family)
MNTTLIIIAVTLGILGLVGTIVPVLPGTIISFLGLVAASFTEGSNIEVVVLTVWGVVSLAVIALDYLLPGYFSKRFGGTKWGSWGATIGTIVGIFIGPAGLILGPFAGAVIGELLGEKLTMREAIRVGFGSMLSFVVGSLFKFIVGVFMLYYIIKDII